MIQYKDITFPDYVDLMYYIIRKDNDLDPRLFPSHTTFFVRAALQDRFNKKFALKEVKRLLAEELALGYITLLDEKE